MASLARAFRALSLSVLMPSAALAQSPTAIVGEVRDGTTNAPIVGALVSIPEQSLSDITDADGRFTLTGIVEGEFEVTVEALGYIPLRQVTQVGNGDFFRIGLNPAPFAIDELVVTVTQIEQTLQTRRDASGVRVERYDGEELTRSGLQSAAVFVQERGMLVTCPSLFDLLQGVRACVSMRNRLIPIKVYLDDRPQCTNVLALETLHMADIYSVELWNRGTEVRVFTRDFIDRVTRGRDYLNSKPPPNWCTAGQPDPIEAAIDPLPGRLDAQ